MRNLLKKAMKTSISEVLETMFYMSIEFQTDYSLENSAIMDIENIIVCRLDFKGRFSGFFTIFIPKDLLLRMSMDFMGESENNITTEHLEGTIREIVNMVAGSTFSHLDKKAEFNLSIPAMIDMKIAIQKNTDYHEIFLLIQSIEGVLALQINFKS